MNWVHGLMTEVAIVVLGTESSALTSLLSYASSTCPTSGFEDGWEKE
ncbi:hypothetical protein A2U01_0056975, partial [Trifolium medium]|nr:hypothetical protein [Trifolium medium]